jgi:hypothetical protein
VLHERLLRKEVKHRKKEKDTVQVTWLMRNRDVTVYYTF